MSDMRLIDANVLTRLLESVLSNANPLDRKARAAFSEVLARVKTMPDIDAVPVVRCRECKKCRNREPNIGIHWCDHWDNVVRDKDFCSFGERKADGGSENV